jgi:tetratricopeptide (TPR) repeat protein
MFMSDQYNQEILDELRKQTKLWKNTTIITPVIFFIIIGLIFVSGRYFLKKDQPARPQAKPSWTQARDAFDNCNYEDALHVAKILTEKSPKYWYGYSFLGGMYTAMGDFKNAEINFAKAYELFPTKENKENLDAVRIVLSKM